MQRIHEEDKESPQRDELEAPFVEVVVARYRLMAAGNWCRNAGTGRWTGFLAPAHICTDGSNSRPITATGE